MLKTTELNMQTTIISPTDKIEAFIKYLPKPEWFKQKFKPEFDYYRKRNSGYVILAKDSNGENVLGCIYCEPTGKFLYKGGSVAIFGWPYADSPEIMHHLFEKAKKLCLKHEKGIMRGPINPPKLFGGWGRLTEGFETRPLVNSAWNSEEDYEFFTQIKNENKKENKVSGETVYYNYRHNKFSDWVENDSDVAIISPEPSRILQMDSLLLKLNSFIGENFYGFLPDNSNVQGQMHKFLEIFDMFDGGNDFYQIALEKDTGEIAGFSTIIPNLFDLWKGEEITSGNWDTYIIGKKWRRTDFSDHLWQHHRNLMLDRGITEIVNTYMWEKNQIVIKKQSHFSEHRNTMKLANYKTESGKKE